MFNFSKNGINYTVEEIFAATVYQIRHPINTLRKETIVDILDMESLYILRTNVQTIEPGAFKNLPKLTNLRIKYANLTTIESEIFNNLNVTELILNDCNIKTIASEAFENMTRLERLDLSWNQLNEILPVWFTNTPSLKNVQIRFNNVRRIPANLIIDPSGNREFNINLEGNKIAEIDQDAFQGINKIERLQLNNNELTRFSGDCLRNVFILELLAYNNKIQCLDDFDKVFVGFYNDMSGNPWNTTCLKTMKEWAQEKGKIVLL